MKSKQFVFTALLSALAPISYGQINVSQADYYAQAQYGIANNYSDVVDTHSGNVLTGGTQSAHVEGDFTYSGRLTTHVGNASIATSNLPAGLSGTFTDYAKTTYISGGYPYLASVAVSTIGTTVKFTVGSSGVYRVKMDGTITKKHGATDTWGQPAYWYNLRLDSSLGGASLIDLFAASNSGTLSNVPYSHDLNLATGVTYTLSWNAATAAGTVNEGWQAPSGAYGESEYTGSYSLAPVPEPSSIAALGLACLAFRSRRNKK